MRPSPPLQYSLILAVVLVTAAGCGGPTYHREHLAESLEEILVSEGLKVSVRFLEHTLAVHLEYPDSLIQRDQEIAVGPAFEDAIIKVIPAIHRVVFSSDANASFYVLLVSDPNIPGAYLTMIRYVDDVRRANANMLDPPEMFSRTVFDLNYVGTDALTIDQYVPRDIRLEEFLSWQLARRIQQLLTNELQASGETQVGRCLGEFRNGEFAFTLNITSAGGGALNEQMVGEAFEVATKVIAQVLSSYKFESFDKVRLIYPGTGRNFVFPKSRLEFFR